MKRHSKKLGVLLLLVISVVFMSFRSAQAEKEETKFTNLKVLPKKIAHDDLIAVMKNYNTALGVKCNYCHVKNGEEFDFASDQKEEKHIARKMQKMANTINKKYFGGNSGTVGCMTCHNGKKNPNDI
ncbi:MAG: hypothetical protein RJA25_1725 [Bacteroidota bacterium]